MDKRLIAERFAKARGTYGHEARVQQQVAEKMLRLLLTATSSRFRHIVEFGCGTGCYSRLLQHTLQPDTLLLNDLCPEMRECVEEMLACNQVKFFPCDAETLDFPQGSDLITSCSTLQWFADAGRFFTRCHHFLAGGGILAFSTFGKQNMQEIRALTGHGLDYLPLEHLKALLSPGFDILYAEEEIVSLPFATPLRVLQHLKQTGVTGTDKKIWTKGRLQAFCDEYIRLFGDESRNVPLTYHPIYIIARKKQEQ